MEPKPASLLNTEFLEQMLLKDAPWSFTHGVQKQFLGLGLVYYCITYILRARVAVCLGSGGGFVPRIMRQAQRDAGIGEKSRTILIDADDPTVGFGSPEYLHADSFFRTSYPEIELMVKTTKEAAEMFRSSRPRINYLHIDANHSFEGCLFDYETYRGFMASEFVITMHDTRFSPGVMQAIEEISKKEDIELINLNNLAYGLAIIKPASKVNPVKHAISKAQAFFRHPAMHIATKAQKELFRISRLFRTSGS
jgi:hypothetical protein